MSTKTFYCIIIILVLISCNDNTNKLATDRLIVDAGSFLDSTEANEIEGRLRSIEDKGKYNLFLYTVIAEKYYKHANYDEYIFSSLSNKDTNVNTNILLYLSYNDKKIRINTGNKARETLTDSLCQVAVNRLIPYLNQRKYYDGIKATINYIDSVMNCTNIK
jgi:uncharacterized membrane protein YgcG